MANGFTTGLWNGLKRICGIDNVTMPDPWKNLVIPGPSTYSNIRKPFNEVLDQNAHIIGNLTYIQHSSDENNGLNIQTTYVRTLHNDDPRSLSIRIDTKRKISNMFRPYVQLNHGQTFGLKIEDDDDRISGDVGIQLGRKFPENGTHKNVLYYAGQIKYPHVVRDVKFEVSPQMRLVNVETSSVYGSRFNNFGVLAGFKLKCNESAEYLEWKKMCRAVTFGLVFPAAAGQLTLKPHNNNVILDAYWKVNNKIEVATSLKSNWRNPEWISHDHELGMKYKQSDKVTCNLKTDLARTITAGLSLINKSFKFGFCLQSNIRHFGKDRKVGCSFEF